MGGRAAVAGGGGQRRLAGGGHGVVGRGRPARALSAWRIPGPSPPTLGTLADVSDGFDDIGAVGAGLAATGYLADDAIATAVYLAQALRKPVLVEGPAGTGKTELAKSVAAMTGARLIRLQCYEGLDESRALYEWDYRKQLLRIQAGQREQDGSSPGAGDQGWDGVEDDLFSERFLLTRPLLEAIRAPDPVVLLVDEVDRLEVETEALLLEVLSDYQVSIPELGTVAATRIPLVVLTSNNTRELSEALKRRCLYLPLDYPDVERERAIVMAKVPDVSERLAEQVARVVRSLRALDLQKPPSVSETLDWARTLVLLSIDHVDVERACHTLPLLLKHRGDLAKATKSLTVSGID
ncbi:MAG: MoxR family ATPase [Actinobacteria bacterium]|nr:MoxR family ATPase [Actinomycetota bacterium]